MIRHTVLLKFRPDVTQATIDEVFKALAALQEKISGIVSFHGGPYSSPEGLNQGFAHGFSMDFSSEKERDAYLPHPEHEIVKGMIIPLLADNGVIAFDFEF